VLQYTHTHIHIYTYNTLCSVNKSESDFLTTAVYVMVVFMLFMVIADACVLLTAITVFMKPLELMARHLKIKGAKIDLDHLRQLAKRKNFLGAILVCT
jgi:hypothetical protein